MSFDRDIIREQTVDVVDASQPVNVSVQQQFTRPTGKYRIRVTIEMVPIWEQHRMDEVCACGHTYDRHFDYMSDRPDEMTSCKYCECYQFVRKDESHARRVDS